MAEYEPATAGRETSLLLEVLAQTFKGDVRGSLDEFEVKIRRYERSCNEVAFQRILWFERRYAAHYGSRNPEWSNANGR